MNNANDTIYALALQPEGKRVLGGDFAMIGGQMRKCIARISRPRAS